MAPKFEERSLSRNILYTANKVRLGADKLMYQLPIIGPIRKKVPGRQESLLFSTVIPVGVGLVEWGMYEYIRQTGADPLALGLITIGVLAATKIIEREALIKREWSSNSWTLLFVDTLKLFHTENKALKKILEEPLTAEVLSKFVAIITYPVTLKAINDAVQAHNAADLSYITFVQLLGDLLFAGLNGAELLKPGSVKRDPKPPKEYIKF